MVGVNTVLEALQRRADTRQVTFKTNELAGGQTHEIELDEDSNKIDTVEFKPSDESLASEAVLLLVRPIVVSGSTDTSFVIHEDSDRENIDEVFRVSGLSVNEGTQSFQPGGGQGIQFDNQSNQSRWYLTLDELSGNSSVYKIRLRWFDVSD